MHSRAPSPRHNVRIDDCLQHVLQFTVLSSCELLQHENYHCNINLRRYRYYEPDQC